MPPRLPATAIPGELPDEEAREGAAETPTPRKARAQARLP